MSLIRTLKCTVCSKYFETEKPNNKYCSGDCRKQGRKIKRKAWEELNPDYNSEAGKVFRGKQQSKKMERHKQFLKDKQEAIERMTGGVFLND